MDIETLKKAITKETSLFSDSKLEIVEIGDGNINRVFRAAAGSGEAYIVKYASSQTNISSSIRLNKARGRIESDYLKIIGQLMPLRVPVVYEYSEKNHYIIMQDLSKQYKVLQGEIASGKQYVFLAKQLAEYVAVSGYAFSGFSLLPDRKLMLQKQFSNQQMCELTERLVFTEPYFDCANNSITCKNYDFVKNEIYLNSKIASSVQKLKNRFLSSSQSLIHGDLHFGSVFVSEKDIKIFDPEFCFFGPIGYDLGNLLAHFLLHFSFQAVTKTGQAEGICSWLKQQAFCLLAEFEACFLKQAGCCDDTSNVRNHDIREFLKDILCDTAGFAGTECIRRTIGLAKVSAFVFSNEEERSQYELRALSVGKYLLENFEVFTTAHTFEERLNAFLR